ncbi:hypothetical protein SAMN05421837_107312 [Amycolatopsis pretoriensis]|uniref:Uncharacterized protein n=1 Tax=Amycolatopsis pretoriensis TaxID=218821 RepID=A0A1H5R7F1_9PSEU|nr:hypothetical protein [Amycolatopsis pretoriensis]SEF34303.1 hypothetical protein SAMN05421837_107312 [Amycolatopsis pretoriensis]
MTWEQPVVAAHAARVAAADAEETMIRTAIGAGAKPTHIAKWLGVRGRNRVYDIANRPGPAVITPPYQPPTVFVAADGCEPVTARRVETVMWAHGWPTVVSATAAWHLCVAGRTVVLCDITHDSTVTVGVMRADDTPGDFTMANGGRVPRPVREDGILDEHFLACLVATAIAGDQTHGE